MTASKYYYPQLDALRGLSFLAVFFYHAYHPAFGTSLYGELAAFLYKSLDYSIDVFFVLSSFLLTWLGINEYERNGNFSFRKYFLRRALRIWPLYYIIMLFSFLVLPYIANRAGVHVTLPPPGWYLFFISNFYLPEHVYFLRFLWTLSVEEQFYLVLGISLLALRKKLELIIYVMAAVSLVYNYCFSESSSYYFHTLTYLFDFAAGSFAALALKKNYFFIRRLGALSMKGSVLYYISLPVIFVISFLLQRNASEQMQDIIAVTTRLIFVLFIAVFILEQMVNVSVPINLKNNRFLIYTGKISYGLYCFHGIVLTAGGLLLAKFNYGSNLFFVCIFLAANYLAATGSYYFIERPFLRLKDKLRRI